MTLIKGFQTNRGKGSGKGRVGLGGSEGLGEGGRGSDKKGRRQEREEKEGREEGRVQEE
jgi:hypothetical protein